MTLLNLSLGGLLAALAPAAEPMSPVVVISESPVAVESPTTTATAPANAEVAVTVPAGESAVVVVEAPTSGAAPAQVPVSAAAPVSAAPPAGASARRPAVIEPLPAPPAPLSRKAIQRGPWRGRFCLGARIGLIGPIAGERPARPTAIAFGGGADLGWRVNNWLGLGTGLSGQIHDAEYVTTITPLGPERRLYYGNMLHWDVAFARLFVPLRRRVQPFGEIGGGLASYERPTGGYLIGGQMRVGLGLEAWVSSNVTLGVIGGGRYTRLERRFAEGPSAHPAATSYQVVVELGFHW